MTLEGTEGFYDFLIKRISSFLSRVVAFLGGVLIKADWLPCMKTYFIFIFIFDF